MWAVLACYAIFAALHATMGKGRKNGILLP